ncbi:MAG: hypothetical protein CME67_00570 [Halobacteriovoraceae bacterium]|nr:hypothetical protein [Halobacteriovoraceae bacterium]|tara:strand:- start:1065 stop:1955 length:891 start_codon:yes stop_codon:yes gene_type:complete
MNEIFDKLLIRFLFTVFICLGLLFYKYAHVLFYPSQKKQILKKIYPSENYVDTLHVFSRLIGIALIFSTLEFNEYIGFVRSVLDFFILGTSGIVLYLVSLYIMDNIVFYNFEYKDEVLKKKNASYGIVSFSQSICMAFLVRNIFQESEHSLIILFILWLFALVLFGFSTKLFAYVSKLSFNSLMIQKNIGLAFSYSGFLFGNALIIMAAFHHEHHDIVSYCIQVVLKTLLGALIFPVFRAGVIQVFQIQEGPTEGKSTDTPHLGYGIYEGSVFLMVGLLTSIIIGQIHFGTIYPFF